jgi:hypothetical protein
MGISFDHEFLAVPSTAPVPCRAASGKRWRRLTETIERLIGVFADAAMTSAAHPRAGFGGIRLHLRWNQSSWQPRLRMAKDFLIIERKQLS